MPEPNSAAIPVFFDKPRPPAGDPVWTRLRDSPVGVAVFDDLDTLANAWPTLGGHIPVYGYVDTSVALGMAQAVPLADVETATDQFFAQFPGLTGMFFDQGLDENATADAFTYFFTLDSWMHTNHPGELMMVNCAGARDDRVLRAHDGGPACDIAVLVEKQYASYNSTWWNGASSGWWLDPALQDRIAHVVWSCPTLGEMAIAVKLARNRNCKYLYVFDGTSSAYSHLPAYWDEEADLLNGGTDPCDLIQGEITAIEQDIRDWSNLLQDAVGSEKAAIARIIRALNYQLAALRRDLPVCRALP